MKCPECNTWTRVIETYNRKDNKTRRRYECANMHRFTTLEIVVPSKPKKEKDDE